MNAKLNLLLLQLKVYPVWLVFRAHWSVDPQFQLLLMNPPLHLPHLRLPKSYWSFSCKPSWASSKLRFRLQSRDLCLHSNFLGPLWSQKSYFSSFTFPTYNLENCIWIPIRSVSNGKIIWIHLEPREITAPSLRVLFFVTALAPARHSTYTGIFKKKGQMLIYYRKSSRLSSAKIAAVPKLFEKNLE